MMNVGFNSDETISGERRQAVNAGSIAAMQRFNQV